jgi:RimJ/RimL family protein N-acetyltransferase
VQEFVGMFLAHQQTQPRFKFQLAVVLRSSGELIGNCGIRKDFASAREADMGYELSPEHWGRGYATEAARAVLRFGFAELGVHRVWSCCVPENTASAHVLEKIGMRQEGHLREKEFFKDRWWDSLVFAILEDEWREIDPGPWQPPSA